MVVAQLDETLSKKEAGLNLDSYFISNSYLISVNAKRTSVSRPASGSSINFLVRHFGVSPEFPSNCG